MQSIRNKLTASLLVGSVAILIVVDVVIATQLRSWLVGEFDDALHAKARTIASLIEQDEGIVEFDPADEYMPEFGGRDNAEYYELYVAGVGTHTRSESLGDRSLPRGDPLGSEPAFANLELPDGRRGRLVRIEFDARTDPGDDDEADPAAGEPDTTARVEDEPDVPVARRVFDEPARLGLIVARGRGDLDGLLAAIYGLLALVSALYAVAVAIMTRFAVARGLQPLTLLNREIETIDERSLERRVALARPVTELTPVVEALNRLLDRLEAALEKEKRFTGDVAHELRTPLAELRNLADVGGAWPEDAESIRAFFNDVRDIADEMLVMTENLLTLARCDADTAPVRVEEVPLAQLLHSAWAPLSARAQRAEVSLAMSVPEDLSVKTDAAKIGLVFTNVMDNLISYSPAGSVASCTVSRNGGAVAVRFVNPTTGLTPDDLQLMFDRFWRKDPARTGGRHAGLGLSVVRALCDLLDVRIDAALDAGPTFSVTLDIPAQGAPAP